MKRRPSCCLLVVLGLSLSMLVGCADVTRAPERDVAAAAFSVPQIKAPGTERQSETVGGEIVRGTFPALSHSGLVSGFHTWYPAVPEDLDDLNDVYVRDRLTGAVTRASVADDGSPSGTHAWWPVLSGNGRVAAFAFECDYPGPWTSAYVRDLVAGRTEAVAVSADGDAANGHSWGPVLSFDGRFVVFMSSGDNLVDGDANGELDVFIRDRVMGVTELVSVSSSGEQGNGESHSPAVSADGRFVAFVSSASNLVPNDGNGHRDVFVRDRVTGETVRVSVSTVGSEGDGASGYGRYVPPSVAISADGRVVAFVSEATNLVAGDTNGTYDVFVRDSVTGVTDRVSVRSDGGQANGRSEFPSLSALGNVVTFASSATNLDPLDSNGVSDAFVRDRRTGVTERVSMADDGSQANGESGRAVPSAGGTFVAFESWASNLIPGATSRLAGVYVRTRTTPESALLTLINEIDIRVPDVLSRGRANALAAPLEAARNAYLAGRHVPACHQIDAFIHMVDRGSKGFVGDVTADALQASAEGIRATMACAR